jgi:hypothetical protein
MRPHHPPGAGYRAVQRLQRLARICSPETTAGFAKDPSRALVAARELQEWLRRYVTRLDEIAGRTR